MASSATLLPAPEKGWTLFVDGVETAHHHSLAELAGRRSDIVIGLPAAAVSTFVVTLPRAEASLHESMIFAQIERRGLANREGETLFDFEAVEAGESGATFVVTVVTALADDLVAPNAAGYATAASLKKHGDSPCLVYREHGRLVLAVFLGVHPAHLQVLSGAPGVEAASAAEINLILLSLRGEPAFADADLAEVELAVSGIPEGDLAAFRNILSVPVSVVRDPGSVTDPRARDRLLPPAVKRARSRHRNRRRNLVLFVTGLIVYLVVGAWVWTWAKRTEREIESLEKRIAIVEPDVERIQLAEQRWKQLEPAFEMTFFPVVQLSRITSALPGSGVVVREYRTSGRSIRIQGQARDVQLANRLLEDLKGMDAFAAYAWSMPNPKVESNNTATFEIEGKPKDAGAEG
ncbi:MAG: hypothetical protein WD342_15700 [Verrucomicrobiales bacterium]